VTLLFSYARSFHVMSIPIDISCAFYLRLMMMMPMLSCVTAPALQVIMTHLIFDTSLNCSHVNVSFDFQCEYRIELESG